VASYPLPLQQRGTVFQSALLNVQLSPYYTCSYHTTQSTAISTYKHVHVHVCPAQVSFPDLLLSRYVNRRVEGLGMKLVLHMLMKLLAHKHFKCHVHCSMHSHSPPLWQGRGQLTICTCTCTCGAVFVSYCGSDLPLVHRLPTLTGRQSTVLAGSNFWLTIMCTLPQACIHTGCRLSYALCTALSDCSPFHCVQCPSLSGYVEMPAVLCVTGEGPAPKETQAKVVCTLAMS